MSDLTFTVGLLTPPAVAALVVLIYLYRTCEETHTVKASQILRLAATVIDNGDYVLVSSAITYAGCAIMGDFDDIDRADEYLSEVTGIHVDFGNLTDPRVKESEVLALLLAAELAEENGD